MSDFGFLSDTDDSAVEELISQAKELSVLEQVAAINCSGFTDSVLSDDLESRFRRLKSLPNPESSTSSSKKKKKKQLGVSKSTVKKCASGSFSPASSGDEERIFSGGKVDDRKNLRADSGSLSLSDEESRIFSENKHNPSVKSGLKKDYRSEFASDGSEDLSDSGKIGSSSSNTSRDSKIFSAAKKSQKLPKEKSRIGTTSSPSTDPNPEERSKSKWLNLLSPSKAIGCMWRSPNKSSNNKTMKNSKSFNAYSNRDKAIDFDEFLSDLGTLPVEEQRKMLKKAIKEQQKMRREASKIIKMAKQASARFDFDD